MLRRSRKILVALFLVVLLALAAGFILEDIQMMPLSRHLLFKSTFLEGVTAGLLSSLVLTLLVFYAVVKPLSADSELSRFFAVGGRRKVAIFASNLVVNGGGTTALEKATRGYEGSALMEPEFKGALLIRDALDSQRVPDWLRALTSVKDRLRTLPDIFVSPTPNGVTQELETYDTLILIGSQIYNSLTKHLIRDGYFRFDEVGQGGKTIRVIRGTNRVKASVERKFRWQGRDNLPPDEPSEPAFLQKVDYLYDGRRRTIVTCAGIGIWGTFASAWYLASHWREIFDEVGDSEFGIYLYAPEEQLRHAYKAFARSQDRHAGLVVLRHTLENVLQTFYVGRE
jgi:hypothetical protein